MRPISLFVRGVNRLNELVYAAIRWLTLAMILIGAFNAVARYLTRWTGVSLSSNAYFDLQWQMFSLIFLLGAAYALRADFHVRVDAVYSRIAPRSRLWVDLVGHLLFLIPFCVLLLVTSYPAVRNSWAVREASTDPGGLVRYPIKTAILVGASLLLLQAIAEVVKKVTALRGNPIEPEIPVPNETELVPHPGAEHTPLGGI
jgi:TRAP-type mannitol/chloroaromatic compound transport system permease small subunit